MHQLGYRQLQFQREVITLIAINHKNFCYSFNTDGINVQVDCVFSCTLFAITTMQIGHPIVATILDQYWSYIGPILANYSLLLLQWHIFKGRYNCATAPPLG
jgi:hypothetical protein